MQVGVHDGMGVDRYRGAMWSPGPVPMQPAPPSLRQHSEMAEESYLAARSRYQDANTAIQEQIRWSENLIEAFLRSEADEVVCLATPEPFRAIGLWYTSFPQLCDEEVRRTLSERWAEHDASGHGPGASEALIHSRTRTRDARTITENEVLIRSGAIGLEGTLRLPQPADGLVVFAHGSGSTRFSARNRFVAEHLNEAGLATLLFDLLTEAEQAIDEHTGELRFDIALLSERLTGSMMVGATIIVAAVAFIVTKEGRSSSKERVPQTAPEPIAVDVD
mgnify:CR=1 FL=1